jgi:hypothetical protein
MTPSLGGEACCSSRNSRIMAYAEAAEDQKQPQILRSPRRTQNDSAVVTEGVDSALVMGWR